MDFKRDQEVNLRTRNVHLHMARGTSFVPGNLREAGNSQVAEKEESKKIVQFLDGFITVCLSALFFGMPLFFTNATLQGISFEKQTYFYFWILLALVGWVTKGVIVGEMKIHKTPLDLPIFGFWIFYAISTIFSVDRWHSFWGFFGDPSRGLMNVTGLIVLYYLIVSHFNVKRFFVAISLLTVANFLTASLTLLQIMGAHFPEKIAKIVPLSTMGSLSGLGTFLGAMLPILMILIFALAKKHDRKRSLPVVFAIGFLLLTFLINMFVLLVLFGFVSWLAVLVGVSFFLVHVLARIVELKENWTWLPMVAFMGVLIISMIGANTIARISLPSEISPSFPMSWEIAKNSLKNNFFLGSGPATYGYDFSLHKPQSFNLNQYYNLRFYQGTGIFFEAISTVGVVGTILLLLATLTFLGAGTYLLSIDKKRNKIFSLGVFSAALVTIVAAFSGKTEGGLLALGVMLISLAVAMLNHESGSENRQWSLSLKASPKFALTLAFIFMIVSAGVVFVFVFIGRAYVADMLVGQVSHESSPNVDGDLEKLVKATNLYNQESRYYDVLGQELLSSANQEALKGDGRNLGKIQQNLNDAILFANHAKDLSKNDVGVVEILAQTYENSGLYVADSLKLAIDNYSRALELEPHNPVYFLKIGQIKLSQAANEKDDTAKKADINDAKSWFQKAVDEKSNFAEAQYQLGLVQEMLADRDGAIASLQKAITLDNTVPKYFSEIANAYAARGIGDDYKIAEGALKSILAANDNDFNTHLSLGLLYEKMKKFNDAALQYKKVSELIGDQNKDAKTQIQKMIDNANRGIENTPENINESLSQ